MYGIESNGIESAQFNFFAGIGPTAVEKQNPLLCAESGSPVRGHPTSSRRPQAAYQQQIERIRREQGLLYHSTPHRPSNTRHSPTLSSYPIPLQAHIMQAAQSEAVVTFPLPVTTAGPTPNYPSAICSVTGASSEITHAAHLSCTASSKHGRALQMHSPEQTIIAGSHGDYLDMSHGMGGTAMSW